MVHRVLNFAQPPHCQSMRESARLSFRAHRCELVEDIIGNDIEAPLRVGLRALDELRRHIDEPAAAERL